MTYRVPEMTIPECDTGWLSWKGTPFLVFSAKRGPAAIVTRRRRARYPSDKTLLQPRDGKAESASAIGTRCDLRSIWIISGISLTHLGKYVWDDVARARMHIYTVSNCSLPINSRLTRRILYIRSIDKEYFTKFHILTIHKAVLPLCLEFSPLSCASDVLFLTKC